MAGALLAAAAGIAVLGIGFIRTAGGLAGAPLDGVARGSAITSGPCAGAPAVASAACASPTTPGGASPSTTGAPLAPSAPAGSPSPGPGSSPGPSIDDPSAILAARLQAALDRVRARLAIPGVSATILLPDGTSWSGVSGFADVAARTRVTPDTAFAFASVSKTFTSALVLELIGEGRMHLTDSAAHLLPPLRITIDRRITVGMLLNHTSGLADYFLNPKIDGPLQGHPTAAWTTERTLRYVGKPLSLPGAAWHYANTNYLLLGLIAERATGQTLADAIRTRLLEPVGLAATWYQAGEAARSPLAHGYRFVGTKRTARPIDLEDGSGIAPFRSVITAAAGAGSMAGTSTDLARWARALYGGKVLGPQGTATLLSGFSKTTNYLPGVVYGYGVQAFSIDGHPSLGHSGRLLGFRSAVRHFPIDGLTIAVLTNQSRADPGVIVRALLAAALPVAAPVPVPGRPPVCPTCSMAR
ncbi:MAG TPA: serine hydrolase domain-containing protein [Candidatus Limnocylindrales bacterium]|nr:serine hydrolase domain-containing protein [Candidatus Limnocylindrales bacterium]